MQNTVFGQLVPDPFSEGTLLETLRKTPWNKCLADRQDGLWSICRKVYIVFFSLKFKQMQGILKPNSLNYDLSPEFHIMLYKYSFGTQHITQWTYIPSKKFGKPSFRRSTSFRLTENRRGNETDKFCPDWGLESARTTRPWTRPDVHFWWRSAAHFGKNGSVLLMLIT